ncbi:MAG: hypothetical protein V3U75_01090 [Methylococcaceae bacterium]
MHKLIVSNRLLLVMFSLLLLAGLLGGCSSDDDSSAKTGQGPFSHTHGRAVTDLEKHKFEHDFADQCLAREIRNSVNKDIDRKRFESVCMCIATTMMKNLSAREAEKFLKEHKSTRALQIKFDNAAYMCMVKKDKPKAPKIFNTR